MRTLELLREENEGIRERYELALGRISQFKGEEGIREEFRDYFVRLADFAMLAADTAEAVHSGKLRRMGMEELAARNHALYADILPGNYGNSYGNPTFAVERLGEYGQILTVVYSELRNLTVYAAEGRLLPMTWAMELLISLYNCFEVEGGYTVREAKEALYYYLHDYMQEFYMANTREKQDPAYTFARDIIMESDLSDLRYLYYFGEYITDNEKKIAGYLNSLPEETVRKMAFTYVDGYVRGFETMGVDFSAKSIVGIRYVIGFERMLRHAITMFEGMGKKVTVYRMTANLANRSYGRKNGYFATSPNPQYEYDHRHDIALCYDKKMQKAILQAEKAACEAYRPEYAAYAGPAVLEVFGEADFSPVNKKEAVAKDARVTEQMLEMGRELGMLRTDYIKQEETSYTIIAFPVPSIGERFEEIFAGTIDLNTLDNDAYKRMQQVLVDALDTGNKVIVQGSGRNRTDMVVSLHRLDDPEHQTNFENCTADVNIPVGEVFTSPVLAGTGGVLHVSRVFLNGLEYKDLEFKFSDGMVTDYRCSNFPSEEENRKYIFENILHGHETLPIGEFAIGTNMPAYRMGQKYGIQAKLPILIAEKTGPHFALGDTCYKRSEEHAVFNPDGKEIIARDNEVSILRKTELARAYMNCHTDITIPYNEVAEIAVLRPDGTKLELVRDGKFVIAGAEGLNV